MKIEEKLVRRGLKLNRKRTTVTLIGIILSVAMLSALSIMIGSFRQSLINYQKHKTGNYHVSFTSLDGKQKEGFQKDSAVESWYQLNGMGYASLEESQNEDKPYAYVVSGDEQSFEGACFSLIEGRFPEASSEIVIPRHLKNNGHVNYKVGDEIKLSLGQRVATWEQDSMLDQDCPFLGAEQEMICSPKEAKTYKVVGIMERPDSMVEPYSAPGYTFLTYWDQEKALVETVYVRLNSAGLRSWQRWVAELIGVDPWLYELFNEGDYSQWTDENFDEYSAQMEACGCTVNTNTWLMRYEKIWPIDSTFRLLFELGMVVAFIIIVTSIYCIKNSFEISVSEKVRLYGMLSGIGATQKQLRKHVRIEARILGLIGIPIGLVCGAFASYVLIQITNYLLHDMLQFSLQFVISPAAILAGILLGIVTLNLSALKSARQAGRISPIAAIRNQEELKLKARAVKIPGYVSKLWGIGGVISYKNIKRNRRKYRTTVVSIVICTITFIATNYFMSMIFDTLGTVKGNESCNMTLVCDDQVDGKRVHSVLDGLDNLEEYQLVTFLCGDAEMESCPYSKEYLQYLKKNQIDETQIFNYVELVILEDERFEEYAKSCGLSDVKKQAILCNDIRIEGYGQIPKYENAEEVTIAHLDYGNAEYDQDGKPIEDTIQRIQDTFTLVGSTNERLFGFKNGTNAILFVRESAFWQTKIYENVGKENLYTEIHMRSSKADDLQQNLEDIGAQDASIFGKEMYVDNQDARNRQERSLYLLLGIFAYGFITVIALIGVTNIINTLGTSVELRAREFATLRSVGMTNQQFMRMVRLESIFTSAKSLLIGCALGGALSFAIWKWAVTEGTVFVFRLPIKAMLLCCLVVLALVYTIIWSSLSKVNKRNIIETIKNENL